MGFVPAGIDFIGVTSYASKLLGIAGNSSSEFDGCLVIVDAQVAQW